MAADETFLAAERARLPPRPLVEREEERRPVGRFVLLDARQGEAEQLGDSLLDVVRLLFTWRRNEWDSPSGRRLRSG